MKKAYFYCRKKAAPLGSDRYYACRYVPFRQRKALMGLYALDNEIFPIPFLVSEASVARIKLQWWREAIHSLFQQKSAEHPVLHCLQPYLKTSGWQEDLFIKHIENIEKWLDFDTFETNMEFLQHSARTSGMLAKMAVYLFAEPSEQTSSFASHFAIVMDVTHFLRSLNHYTQHDKMPFSYELLSRLHIDNHSLHDPINSTPFVALLTDQIPFIKAHIDAALRLCPAKSYPKLRYFRIMMLLALANIQNQYEKTSITLEVKLDRDLFPLKKLWLAYRTR
ncbi:MAG: phytoene synthase [Gammaproteobacteria bacterium]|jgi:phytoene synthase|nr:phytoene synthase [Gammaproteobacteria bacterium]